MLTSLVLTNVVIVEHIELSFKEGLTVVTGETGAGKSILLDSLALALGDRADSDMVRSGCDKAQITATFDITELHNAQDWLNERDLDDDLSCSLRRVITKDGRSRAYVNNTPITLTDLKSLGEHLIEIHGQHEHHALLKAETHRFLLDNHAQCQELAKQVRHQSKAWHEAQRHLNELHKDQSQDAALLEQRLHNHQELEDLALQIGETERLEQERKRHAQSDQLLAAMTLGLNALENDDVNALLSQLRGMSQRLQSFVEDVKIQNILGLFQAADIQLQELESELRHYISDYDVDPTRLVQIDERLDCIYSLSRKHRVEPESLIRLHQEWQTQLLSVADPQAQIDKAKQNLEYVREQYFNSATLLSEKRNCAAKNLAAAIEAHMHKLGMHKGQFRVKLKALNESTLPHPNGLESVEFWVSANAGQPFKPLQKSASGGELSRISLAIQIIAAQNSHIPTLIFDEVDVGIGGPTADIVGKLMRLLAKKVQIITVTHLAQVAAAGHEHWHVSKEELEGVTISQVRALSELERIHELARMTGGSNLAESTLSHARDLLEQAQRS